MVRWRRSPRCSRIDLTRQMAWPIRAFLLPTTSRCGARCAWRNCRMVPPPAAAMFAATLPLLLAYPPEMRDRILPLAAETLVAGGEIPTAEALLHARKDDATLDLARAMLQEAQGDSAGALASYDKLAQSRDQSVHARAAVSAVELRLASGAIDARQAAANWRACCIPGAAISANVRYANVWRISRHASEPGVPDWLCCGKASRCSRTTRPRSTTNWATCSRGCCAATWRTRCRRWSWCR